MSARTLLMAAAARVLPGASLDLSFVAPGTLPPGLTFTRASTGTYFDATGTLQSAATNTPRWDYDPSTLALRGLLIEEARTNAVRNSTNTGATVGTPGTVPNAWTVVLAAGLTLATAGVGTDANGLQYVDFRLSGTSPGGVWRLGFDNSSAIVASQNQVWTSSGYVRLTAGTLTGLSGFAFGLQTYATGNVLLANHETSVATPTNASLVSQRLVVTATASDATTVAARPSYSFTAAATAIDVTLRFAGMQFELAPFATSFIPTSAAAVTRAADVCTMPTSTWFNAAASSLAADFMLAQSPNPSATLVRDVCALSDVSANNRMILRAQIVSAATAAIATSVAGTTTASGSLGAGTANAVSKVGGSWNGTAGVGALNGAAAVSYAVGIPSGITTLTIGNDYSGATAYLNGWLRRVRYWNAALSAAQLQSVTK